MRLYLCGVFLWEGAGAYKQLLLLLLRTHWQLARINHCCCFAAVHFLSTLALAPFPFATSNSVIRILQFSGGFCFGLKAISDSSCSDLSRSGLRNQASRRRGLNPAWTPKICRNGLFGYFYGFRAINFAYTWGVQVNPDASGAE